MKYQVNHEPFSKEEAVCTSRPEVTEDNPNRADESVEEQIDGVGSRTTAKLPRRSKTEANRANAKKSTGPRTARGKDISRFNALKHGATARTFDIFTAPHRPEAEKFRALAEAIDESLGGCQFPEDLLAINKFAMDAWRIERIQEMEAAHYQSSEKPYSGMASYFIGNIIRYGMGAERAWARSAAAIKEIRARVAEEAAADAAAGEPGDEGTLEEQSTDVAGLQEAEGGENHADTEVEVAHPSPKM